MLIVQPSEGPNLRVGVTAGRTVGFAVQRNRAKRLLRAAMQSLLADLAPGCDLLLIARQPLIESNLEETRAAIQSLLRRARLLPAPDDR